MKRFDVIIVGGGASGLFAAAELLGAAKSVLIFEPNRFLGRKLRITGKGRCNVTNNCTAEEIMKNVPRNPKFLYSALSKFPPDKIISWFEDAGVPLKTERGRRVFPVSDSANDVADALVRKCAGADIVHEKVTEILTEGGAAVGVCAKSGRYYADNVILATGGRSYPRTGSDGSGYGLAQRLGHTVVKQQPSLVPIETLERYLELDGLTLKNVTLSLYDAEKPKKPVYTELGEMNFASYGISGPLALTASCLMSDEKIACKGYKLVVDFKPALNAEQLEARLLRDILSSPDGTVETLLSGLLPKSAVQVFAERLCLDKSASAGQITRETRHAIISLLKHFELTPTALRSFDEAIITRGGISVKEIDPATMESKLVKNLYFTGEIIDCDGFTGGYNLTIAFSTAYCAAHNIIMTKEVEKWD